MYHFLDIDIELMTVVNLKTPIIFHFTPHWVHRRQDATYFVNKD